MARSKFKATVSRQNGGAFLQSQTKRTAGVPRRFNRVQSDPELTERGSLVCAVAVIAGRLWAKGEGLATAQRNHEKETTGTLRCPPLGSPPSRSSQRADNLCTLTFTTLPPFSTVPSA